MASTLQPVRAGRLLQNGAPWTHLVPQVQSLTSCLSGGISRHAPVLFCFFVFLNPGSYFIFGDTAETKQMLNIYLHTCKKLTFWDMDKIDIADCVLNLRLNNSWQPTKLSRETAQAYIFAGSVQKWQNSPTSRPINLENCHFMGVIWALKVLAGRFLLDRTCLVIYYSSAGCSIIFTVFIFCFTSESVQGIKQPYSYLAVIQLYSEGQHRKLSAKSNSYDFFLFNLCSNCKCFNFKCPIWLWGIIEGAVSNIV